IVDYVRLRRDALPDLLSAKYGGVPGKAGIGYMYGGKNPQKPTSVKDAEKKPDDKGAKNEKWVWEEVGSEGGASSVNTYDNMHVRPGYSWGKNDYYRSKGDMAAIVKRLAELMLSKEGTTQKGGALMVDGGKTAWGTVSHLHTCDGGAGFSALSGAATLKTIED